MPAVDYLPAGSFASRFGSNVMACSCAACKTLLGEYPSIEAAIANGFTCSIHGTDKAKLDFCHRKARPGNRN
jgi:hypothetical protein